MALASVVFIAVFLIIATSAFLVSSRLGIATRLASVVSSGVGSRNWLVRLRAQAPRDSLRAVMEPFEKVLPKSPE